MKAILVDAFDCLVTDDGIFTQMRELLDGYPNTKIVLTSASGEKIASAGLNDLGYDVFTLYHDPEKTDPLYYERMLEHFDLKPEDVVYFEHAKDAVRSARSIGIVTYHYDAKEKDLEKLKEFLDMRTEN